MRPFENDALLSVILLGTKVSPGTVKLSGHDRMKDWDIQKSKGQTGATSKLNGDPIGQFEATFQLAGDTVDDEGRSDFDLWEEFQRHIESTTNGPKPVALPIYHPDLARNHFTEVTNGGVGGLIHDGKGGATVKVKFLEYKPPKPKPPAKAKPKANATGAGASSKPDPNAAAKQELAALVNEAKQP